MLSANEQVLIQKINWTISRQNVLVALLVTSIIGALGVVAKIAPLYFPLIVVILIEVWAIINYEQAIIRYQIQLQKIRAFWIIPKKTMIWACLNDDGSVNYKLLFFYEIIIFISSCAAFAINNPEIVTTIF